MAEASRIVTEMKPDFIDLNFGCPVKKVVGKNGGSSLLKDLPLLECIIKQVVDATALPVTIKFRSGWDDTSIVAVEVAKIAEANGVAAVCLHPRTKAQGFAGEADWALLTKVKHAIKIPVIGSGDIDSPQKAKLMFDQTGCDAVMICRASFGNPWIFKQVKTYLEKGKLISMPDIKTRIDTALNHLHQSIEKHGDYSGLVRMRGQLAWYIKGLPGASKIRAQLVRLPTEAEVIELLNNYAEKLIEQGYGTTEDFRAA
jgi:tRNA-dihydrouridine synthase B